MKVSILIALACSISSAFGAGPLDAVTNIVGGVSGGGAGGSPLDAVTSLAKGGVVPLDSVTGILKGGGLDGVTGILKGGSKGDTGSIGSAFGAGPLDAVTNIVGGVSGGGAGGSPLNAVTSLAKGGVVPLDSVTGILKGGGLDGVTGILKGGSKGDTGSKGASTDIISSLLGTVGNLLGGGCVDGGILQTVFDLLNNLLGGCATGGSGNQLGNIIRDLIATVERIINILGGFRNCDAFQAISSLLCTLAEVLSNIEDLCDDLEGILLTIVLTNFRLYLSILEVVECVVKTLARLLKTQRITTGLCNAVSHATTGLSLAINSVLYGVQSISCLFANPPSNLLQRIIQILGSSISCALVVLQGGVSFSLQDVAQILRQNSVAAIVDDLFECISASLGGLLDNVTGPILGLLGPLAILPTPFNLICSLINNLLPSLICLLNAGSPNFLTIL